MTVYDKGNKDYSSIPTLDINREIMSASNTIDNDAHFISSSSSSSSSVNSSSSSSSSYADYSEQKITFLNYAHNYCISIVDIVDSTMITDRLIDSEQIRNYYSLFLNAMALIIKQHNGKVIKNAGDCLIYYFPKTIDSIRNNNNSATDTVNTKRSYNNKDNNNYSNNNNNNSISKISSSITNNNNENNNNNVSNSTVIGNMIISNEDALQNVLDCGLAMIDARSELNSKLSEFGLPPISYRISANYGRVELATTTNSYNVDLFGPTVNICSKINHLALPNQMVIYKDLYDVIEKTEFFKDYRFNKIKDDKYFASLHSIYSVNYYVSPSLVVAASNTDTTAANNKRNMHIVIEDKQQNKKQKKPLQQHHQEFDTETKTIIKKQKNNAWTDLMAKNKRQEEISNSSFNILIIDDDKDILFTFASIMEMEGFKTTSISNPIKALNYFSQIDPYYYDLIIMDIRMPGLNGLQLYFKLKVMNPELKVLFLSALDAIEEILTIFPEVKSSQIIRKPVESKDLLSKINTILKS